MMTKRNRSGPDDLDGATSVPLPGLDDDRAFRIPPGRVERAVSRSVAAAVAAQDLDPDTHAGAIAAAQSLARIVDRHTPSQTKRATPYESQVAVGAARELAAQLDALGLVPASTGDVDPLAAMLDGLGSLTPTS